MVHFALDGITSFSYLPLRLASYLGAACIAISFVGLAGFAALASININAWGWLGAFAAVWFVGGIQLMCLGILGEYLGRMNDEVKHRPLYLVSDQWGIDHPSQQAR
jgi:dolichol-phosphate mannosyltransferase